MIKKTILDNGMTILTEQIDYANSVAMGLWVRAGSRLETTENAGISHFLEHMNFKGTERRSAKEISTILERRGGHLNAYTAKEHTSFYCHVVNSDYKLAMDVLADLFLHSSFEKNELEKEKRVVVEEINLYEDSPDDCVVDMLNELFWQGHPLAHPILGYADTVRAFDRDRLLAYRAHHYRPEETVFAAAGSLEHEKIVAEAEKLFGDYRAAEPPQAPPRPQCRSGQVRAKKDINQEHVCLAVPGCSLHDIEYFTLLLVAEALGGGPSSRLFQTVREEHALAYTIYAFLNCYRDEGMFGIYAGCAQGKGEQVLEYCRRELADIRQNGLREDELAAVKQEIRGGLLIGQDSLSNRLNRLARNWLYYQRIISIEEVTDAIDRINNTQLTATVRERFKDSNLAVAFLGGQDNDDDTDPATH